MIKISIDLKKLKSELSSKLKAEAKDKLEATAKLAVQELVATTPVDTGLAASSW